MQSADTAHTSTVTFLDGYVKVKRRLVADDILTCDPEDLREMADEVDHGPVGDNDSLGIACGTRSEYAVQGILPGQLLTDRLQLLFCSVMRLIRFLVKFLEIHNLSCISGGCQLFPSGLVHDDDL